MSSDRLLNAKQFFIVPTSSNIFFLFTKEEVNGSQVWSECTDCCSAVGTDVKLTEECTESDKEAVRDRQFY